ncbi:MAG: thermosome subunit beta [Candidatus Hodarchaeales archaeon]|jgi:thermosome
MALTGTPIIILKEGADQKRGRSAQKNNIMAAKAVANAVASTLGPRGRDKLLVDTLGDVLITNDGATVLDELDVQHPAAKMIVQVSKVVDEQTGDGTTSSVILAGELLSKADELLEKKIHPTLMVESYKKATDKAIEILNEIAQKGTSDEELLKIASTAMNSKAVAGQRDQLSKMVVEAVKAIYEEGKEGKSGSADLDRINIIQKQGKSLSDTELIKGVVIDKEVVHSRMPKKIEGAKIALLNLALENKKTEFSAKIHIDDASLMDSFLDQEETIIREMVDKIVDTGANVVFSQKGIDDLAQHFLAKKGVLCARRVKKSDMERMGRATGAKIATTLEEISADDLGSAGSVDEQKIGDEKLIFVRDAPHPKAVALIIRGANKYFTDEAERAIHDALCVVRDTLEDGTYVSGGGSTEMWLSKQLNEFAKTFTGREQIAVQAFAQSFEAIPKTLAENAGLNAMDVLLELRAAETPTIGINVLLSADHVTDTLEAGIVEPLRVKKQIIRSASEAAELILRIDDVIMGKESPGGGMPPGGMGGMPPGMGGMGGMGGMPGMM